MRNRLTRWAMEMAERGAPDAIVRAGMRRTIRARLTAEDMRPSAEREAMVASWHRGPVAVTPQRANEQHYEIPAQFFEVVLGPRLKYSSCLWPAQVGGLADAEEAMLRLTVERSGIADGMRVVDLGCGWGSLSLWIAQQFPAAEVVAVSNSAPQGEFIRHRAREGGLRNVRHLVADVNHLDLDGRFDAAVSVEMFEHVRNHPLLLERLAAHLQPNAPVFVHVFAHRRHAWEFEDRGAGDWMARTFFTGGIMPSHVDFHRLIAPYSVEQSWWIDGRHYQRTLEAWLTRLDANRGRVGAILEPVFGTEAARWLQRWRMFFMACSEFFGHADGDLLGVSHHRLRLT